MTSYVSCVSNSGTVAGAVYLLLELWCWKCWIGSTRSEYPKLLGWTFLWTSRKIREEWKENRMVVLLWKEKNEKQEKKMKMYRLTSIGANILPYKALRMNVSLFHARIDDFQPDLGTDGIFSNFSLPWMATQKFTTWRLCLKKGFEPSQPWLDLYL